MEEVEERAAKNKIPEGEIRFTFERVDEALQSYLVISIEDDGRGLDIAKILKDDFFKLNPDEQTRAVVQKLFYEGMSTKTEVTDISGQGAGLAAVGLVVTKLQGTIEIDLNREVGSKFIFKFPYV
jgi:two-component system, chemotaxis family, sensor kinase CheA